MDQRSHASLIQDIESLRKLVGKCSTESVAGFVAGAFLRWPERDVGLSSPYRQLFYLLGVLMSTKEPGEPVDLDEDLWNKCKDLLEGIYKPYAYMYWPTHEERDQLNDKWHEAREVAMPAFLHYLNSGMMATTGQVVQRIQRYCVPFDKDVLSLLNISVSDMLLVANALGTIVQSDFDRLSELRRRENTDRLAILDKATANAWDDNRIRKEVQKSQYSKSATDLFDALHNAFKVRRGDLLAKCDQVKLERFWDLFTTHRGRVAQLTYPTDANDIATKPLILFSEADDVVIVPFVHSLYLAILEVSERVMQDSIQRNRFFRARDHALEIQTAEILNTFFGAEAEIYPSVYETEDLQYEHDVVVFWRRKLFVVEAKASSLREPMRDPDRAFIRIRDDFRGPGGIQKAYDQAHRIEAAVCNGRTFELFDEHRRTVFDSSTLIIDRVYCVCVTRENFGLLATNLLLLLEKDDSDTYPWATNVADLENLLDAFSYFGWSPQRLCEYLDGREEMHGRVTADDELDFAGYFIEHGGFEHMFRNSQSGIMLDPSYSKVFDRIHRARLGGEPVEYDPHPPVHTDLGAEIEKWSKETGKRTPIAKQRPKKQGRNAPCACGSGKKYKKCCGR